MRLNRKITDWFESHWVTPAYSGGLLGGLSVFFFIAGMNTLSGWLYVISGIGLALLAIAAILPRRTLRKLNVARAPIHPVSAGDVLTIELIIENQSNQPKALIQVKDEIPLTLGNPATRSIEFIPAQRSHHWMHYYPTQRRGIYSWQTVQLRTANPLGLFWCRQSYEVKAHAVVYPTVLPLTRCPLIDEMGQDASLLFSSDRRAHAATEGLTRSLRPYRWGDPIRLVHWRSSARYGELRVRELEVFTGGQELIIALDSNTPWLVDGVDSSVDPFEEAVIAAASLYFYACHRNLNVKLWSAATGLIQGNQVVLEALAATQAGEEARVPHLPTVPIVWLTQNSASLKTLPRGSRWILWTQLDGEAQGRDRSRGIASQYSGILIQPEQPLQQQLQNPASRL
ncbi:MAG: DUF58 domain-containing protein [Oscillatoriales cyanobacterium C42_A2020_001]|nr:DUF58 domain-containing protein [Leptolyngbyaceae cyanobacterium C42_A2020_001]